MKKLVLKELALKCCAFICAAYVAQNKGTTILFWLRSLSTVSTFQGRFNFQGLFKKALYVQVFFQAYVNPDTGNIM